MSAQNAVHMTRYIFQQQAWPYLHWRQEEVTKSSDIEGVTLDRAPGRGRLDNEMAAFRAGFAADATPDPALKAAVAHLRLVTIHPFDDGDGRIARAIADMALARSENSPQRFYSMSAMARA